MNCKPGDLAVIVRANINPEWLGRIVRCTQFCRGFGLYSGGLVDGWLTEPAPPGTVGVADNALRPIRDNDGEDETLTWAPKREGVEA